MTFLLIFQIVTPVSQVVSGTQVASPAIPVKQQENHHQQQQQVKQVTLQVCRVQARDMLPLRRKREAYI